MIRESDVLTFCHVIKQLCAVLWCAQLGADIGLVSVYVRA
jgi:hypothetical protein